MTKRPAVIWGHGGSFRGGSRTSPEIVDQTTNFMWWNMDLPHAAS